MYIKSSVDSSKSGAIEGILCSEGRGETSKDSVQVDLVSHCPYGE